MKTVLLTRKIQLRVDSTDKEYIGKVYEDLYHWQYTCFRAANYIITHLFMQEQMKDILYLNDSTKAKLTDIRKDEDGILTSSRLTTTYQILSKNFRGTIPMSILSNLNYFIMGMFNLKKAALMQGEQSVPNYKRKQPLPCSAIDLKKLSMDEDGHTFRFSLFKIPFRTMLGNDHWDKRELMEDILHGRKQLKTCKLVLDGPKIYLLALVEYTPLAHPLDEALLAEVSCSIEYPLILKIGRYTYTIGNKEEFLHRRLAIQVALSRKQKAATYCRKTNGKKRQYKILNDLKDAETKYVQRKLHEYTRKLIDLCLKHGAGTMLLTNHETVTNTINTDEFLLRNWGYYGMKDMISYKAAMHSIQLLTE